MLPVPLGRVSLQSEVQRGRLRRQQTHIIARACWKRWRRKRWKNALELMAVPRLYLQSSLKTSSSPSGNPEESTSAECAEDRAMHTVVLGRA
jgi:hypothetical protein